MSDTPRQLTDDDKMVEALVNRYLREGLSLQEAMVAALEDVHVIYSRENYSRYVTVH